jgi:hypothetical protein
LSLENNNRTVRPENRVGADAPICCANEPINDVGIFVIPAILKRESTPRLLDARLETTGMTDVAWLVHWEEPHSSAGVSKGTRKSTVSRGKGHRRRSF